MLLQFEFEFNQSLKSTLMFIYCFMLVLK